MSKITWNRPLVAGLDIGNGYIKLKIDGNASAAYISAVACVTSTHEMKSEDVEGVVSDIFNHMDATFDSTLVKGPSRRFFGRRGLTAGIPIQEFDVHAHVSKAENDLSGILALGTLAGKSLQYYYGEHKRLPGDLLTVHASIALALPINEYKRHRESFAAAFKSASSFVTIHNFEHPVRIELVFDTVRVFAEGESAQYGIIAEGESMMAAMLADARKAGDLLEGITPRDVLGARNTVGIDIGEGTTNFPVFQDGRFNPDSSMTYNNGYGSILTRTMERLVDGGLPLRSRKDITEFLQIPATAMNRKKQERIRMVLEEESIAFAQEVNMEFVKIMNRVGAFNEVVFVYGGGATPLKGILQSLLMNTVKTFNEDGSPVLYLDSRYSRFLNVAGLYQAAKKLSDMASKAVADGQ